MTESDCVSGVDIQWQISFTDVTSRCFIDFMMPMALRLVAVRVHLKETHGIGDIV